MPAHLFLKEFIPDVCSKRSTSLRTDFFFQNHILLEQTDLLQTSVRHSDSTRLFCSGPTVYFNERKTFSQEFTRSHSLMPGSQVLKSIKKKKKKSLPHNPPGTFQPSTKIIPETVHISPSISQPGSLRVARLPSPRALQFSPPLCSQAPALSSPPHSHYEPTPGVTATTEQKAKAKLRVKTRPEQPCLSARPRPRRSLTAPCGKLWAHSRLAAHRPLREAFQKPGLGAD